MGEPDSAIPVVRLAPALDINAAAPLASELLARRGKPLVIDASGVERMGGLCLQVLLAAGADWRASSAPMRLADPSPAFAAALTAFGVESAMLNCGGTPS